MVCSVKKWTLRPEWTTVKWPYALKHTHTHASTHTNNTWLWTCVHGQRVKFLLSVVRSCSDSADGRTMNIFITQKFPWCARAYQAVPALISQLATLEAPMSFHPGHSGLNRGQAEFKGYRPQTSVILPMGVYFHHTDQCFSPEGSSGDCPAFRTETLIAV